MGWGGLSRKFLKGPQLRTARPGGARASDTPGHPGRKGEPTPSASALTTWPESPHHAEQSDVASGPLY